MNKRFKELAEQAGFDVKRLMVMHPGGFPRDDFLALESFAELIVRECVEVSERTGTLNEADFEGAMIADAIREHFGVEK